MTQTWLAVSTHEGEYEEIRRAHQLLKNQFSQARLIICPRHPQLLSHVKSIFNGDNSVTFNHTLGNMEPYFEQADVVFVGGTFNPRIGGHNIIEPVSRKKPTIIGPHTDKINELIHFCEGVIQVQNGDELGTQLIKLFSDEALRKQVAETSHASYLKSKEGVLDSYMTLLTPIIDAELEKPSAIKPHWHFRNKLSLKQLKNKYFPTRYLWHDWRYWLVKPQIIFEQFKRLPTSQVKIQILTQRYQKQSRPLRERLLLEHARKLYPEWDYPKEQLGLNLNLTDYTNIVQTNEACIITAINSEKSCFEQGIRLIRSIRAISPNTPIGVLDCGLSHIDKTHLLNKYQVDIKTGFNHFNPRHLITKTDYHHHPELESSKKEINTAPYEYHSRYQSLFPGYSFYLFMNPDTWFTDSKWFKKIFDTASNQLGRILLKHKSGRHQFSCYIHEKININKNILFLDLVRETRPNNLPVIHRKTDKSLSLLSTIEAEDTMWFYGRHLHALSQKDGYPYYGKSWKPSKLPTADDIALPDYQESLNQLTKCFVFPVASRRNTIVGFGHAMLIELEKRGWHIIDSDTDDVKNKLNELKYDIAIFYMTNMSEDKHSEKSTYFYKEWPNFSRDKSTNLFISEDINYPKAAIPAKFFAEHADAILTRYAEAFYYQMSPISKPLYLFPHAASSDYFKATKPFLQKIPRLLVSGALNPVFYPLRSKAIELFRTGQFPIDIKTHIGYSSTIQPDDEIHCYAKTLASYQLALTGVATGKEISAPYIVAKHFEIPATGTVMVTDKLAIPLLEPLGFIEGVHYLATTPNELAQDLERWLEPKNQAWLEQIGCSGQKLVRERHTMTQRIDQLERIAWKTWCDKNHATHRPIYESKPSCLNNLGTETKALTSSSPAA